MRMLESMVFNLKNNTNTCVNICRKSITYSGFLSNSETEIFKNMICEIYEKNEEKVKKSFCYLSDLVNGIFKIIIDGIDGEVYNISTDTEGITVKEFENELASILEEKDIKKIESDSFENSFFKNTTKVLDNKKILSIGWQPQVSLREGLERSLDIYNSAKEAL